MITREQIEQQLEMERAILAAMQPVPAPGELGQPFQRWPSGMSVYPYYDKGQENRVRGLEIMLEEWRQPSPPPGRKMDL
jgi:hypothetical protein